MSEETGEANLTIAAALVDELAGRGVRHAVICPGSRSTPVALALAAHPSIKIWVHVDERSAAFFALGMARQLEQPAALLSTSGTAAANFLPAVVEARLSRIPLIVLTADRPPEMRGWGAAQTIDQVRLFGEHVKWFADMPVPEADAALVRQARAAAARAVATARSSPTGPVHLNLPFREPLLPVGLRPENAGDYLAWTRLDGEWAAEAKPGSLIPSAEELEGVASTLSHAQRAIVVCGPGEAAGLARAAARLAAATGFPVLADALSGLRFGDDRGPHIITGYDAFIRDAETAERLAPDAVVRVGAIPTSKPLQQFLALHPGRQHIVVEAGAPRDPAHLATDYVHGDPVATLDLLASLLSERGGPRDSWWLDAWQAADTLSRGAIDDALAAMDELFEGRAIAEVAAALPDGATLVAGNSMPVRDVDAFVRGDNRNIRVVANRGANGIDGVVSSALGAAAVAGGPVALVVGDLSFFHDLNGLLAARRFGVDATIVLLNNDGGGIFSFLPQAEQLDENTFEVLFGTPVGLDFAAAAELYGASHARPREWVAFRRDLRRALMEPGLSVVEVVTERTRNAAQHRAISAAVSQALRLPQPAMH